MEVAGEDQPRSGAIGAAIPLAEVTAAKGAREAVILRGISGAGKSSLVARLAAGRREDDVAVCSADDYFATEDGGYRFVRSQIVRARLRPPPRRDTAPARHADPLDAPARRGMRTIGRR